MKNIGILSFKNGKLKKIEDLVAEECIVNVEINSSSRFRAIMTKNDIKYFVYGNLFADGIINSKEDVKSYSKEEKNNVITVKIKIKNFSKKNQFKNYNIVWTECGVATTQRFGERFEEIQNKFNIKAESFFKIKEQIKDKIELFKKTGAFHYAFIFNKNIELKEYAYDIGRHNACDKVVGKLLLKDMNFDDKILFTTGRVTSDIILKCIRAKIPIIITRSAPLYNAIILSKKYNICLIGFLRGNRFNVYSNQKIIDFKKENEINLKEKMLLQNNC